MRNERPMAHPSPPPARPRRAGATVAMLLGGLLAFILACGTVATDIVETNPRWACPTPTPQPYGDAGPVKGYADCNCGADPVTGAQDCDQCPVYYEEWEQEYGDLGGPPFPAPTPFTKIGTTFYLGQIINLGGGVDVQLSAHPSAHMLADQRVYMVDLTVQHGGSDPLVLNVAQQVVLTSIARPDGRHSAGTWRWSAAAATAAGAVITATADLTQTIDPGMETTFAIPIAAPDGHVQAVDLRFDRAAADGSVARDDLRLQLTASTEPDCDHPGTFGAVFDNPGLTSAPPVAPAAGAANDIVAFALDQLGRQYCWGGKGWTPCSGCSPGAGCVTPACADPPCWDCSGLTWGAYLYGAGITIGHGTANQQNYQPIDRADIRPGDLILFAGGPLGSGNRFSGIQHVGLYAGDLDGDGTGDMIHAANYPSGTVIDYDIFANTYWSPRIAVITRPG